MFVTFALQFTSRRKPIKDADAAHIVACIRNAEFGMALIWIAIVPDQNKAH